MFLSKYLVKQRMTTALYQSTQMPFVTYKGDRMMNEKGRGEEEVYFNRQEREVMKKLLLKMEQEAQAARNKEEESSSDSDTENLSSKLGGDSNNSKVVSEDEAKNLKEIFKTHGINVDDGLLNSLNDWKNKK